MYKAICYALNASSANKIQTIKLNHVRKSKLKSLDVFQQTAKGSKTDGVLARTPKPPADPNRPIRRSTSRQRLYQRQFSPTFDTQPSHGRTASLHDGQLYSASFFSVDITGVNFHIFEAYSVTRAKLQIILDMNRTCLVSCMNVHKVLIFVTFRIHL